MNCTLSVLDDCVYCILISPSFYPWNHTVTVSHCSTSPIPHSLYEPMGPLMTSTPNIVKIQPTQLPQNECTLFDLSPIQTDVLRINQEGLAMGNLKSSYMDISSSSSSSGSSTADDIVDESFLSDSSENIDISDTQFESALDFWYMRNRWYDNVEKITVFL